MFAEKNRGQQNDVVFDSTKGEPRILTPLEQEAQDMLVKWEAGDAETKKLWKQMNCKRAYLCPFERQQYVLNTFLQAAQKGLEARRARIEQRSVLKTYVSSEVRSATQNMSLFQQSAIASVCGVDTT